MPWLEELEADAPRRAEDLDMALESEQLAELFVCNQADEAAIMLGLELAHRECPGQLRPEATVTGNQTLPLYLRIPEHVTPMCRFIQEARSRRQADAGVMQALVDTLADRMRTLQRLSPDRDVIRELTELEQGYQEATSRAEAVWTRGGCGVTLGGSNTAFVLVTAAKKLVAALRNQLETGTRGKAFEAAFTRAMRFHSAWASQDIPKYADLLI